MSPEPDSIMLQLLRQMRAEIGDMRSDLKNDIADVRSDMHSLRADVASDVLTIRSDMATMRRDTSDQIAGLRRAVMEYHTSVIGHGVIISELEARVRRVEQHLDLPALDVR